MGAPYNDRAGSAAGAVFIYLGGSDPSTTPFRVLTGEFSNDQFGWSVAFLGDMNGDGFGDIAVGARFNGSGPERARGKVYLYRGGPSMDAVEDGNWVGSAKDDWFGNAVAGPGDVDGGGKPDLLVGAPYNDTGGLNAGAAYLFRGEDPPGSSPSATYLGESADAQMGWAVSGSGDASGDGHPDVLVGARLQDSGGLSAAGRLYLFPGGTLLSTTALETADGQAANDWLGNSVGDATGYFAVGRGAVLAGAPYDDAAATDAGRGYVLYDGPLTDVADLRQECEALRAWPNPGATRVEFTWNSNDSRRSAIEIFDSRGRLVRSLSPREQDTHATWDLRDTEGRRVLPGIYCVRAQMLGSNEATSASTRVAVLPR